VTLNRALNGSPMARSEKFFSAAGDAITVQCGVGCTA
jgi:hypothetical protein